MSLYHRHVCHRKSGQLCGMRQWLCETTPVRKPPAMLPMPAKCFSALFHPETTIGQPRKVRRRWSIEWYASESFSVWYRNGQAVLSMLNWKGSSTENRWTDSSIWLHGHFWTLSRRRNVPNSLPQAITTPYPLSAGSVGNSQKWPFPGFGPVKNKSRRTTSTVAQYKVNNCI